MDDPPKISAVAPLLPPVVLLATLLVSLGADPALGVTSSRSPFTDEGYHLLNARNLVMFGEWSTGDWNLHLVDGPFGPTMAGLFTMTGVSVEAARAVSVLLSVATSAAAALLVAGTFGRWAGTIAGLALAGQSLFLYYGRLAILEPMVTFFLLAGAVVLASQTDARSWRPGLAAGLLLGLAVATKPSAAFAAVGALAGLLAAERFGRVAWRTALTSLIGMALVGVSWLAVVALPNWDAVLVDLRIWAREPLPGSLGELGDRISEYLTVSDGAIPMTVGLALAALLGLIVGLLEWRRLTPAQRRLIGLATGWFVAGMAVLLVVPYRPNRYLVPLLPPLAMLVGVVGWALLERTGDWRPLRWVAAAGLTVVLVIPGAAAYAGWAADASHRLPEAQRLIADGVQPGDSIAGELAPTLALGAPVTVYVPRRGDRIDDDLPTGEPDWILIEGEDAPSKATDGCATWAGEPVCLVRTP